MLLWLAGVVLINLAGFNALLPALYILVAVAIITFVAAVLSVRIPQRRVLTIIALLLSIIGNPAVLLIGYVMWARFATT